MTAFPVTVFRHPLTLEKLKASPKARLGATANKRVLTEAAFLSSGHDKVN